MPNHEKHFVVGAGIIGCAIALELAHRGAQVVLVEQDTTMQQASFAAAGMLAAADPHNPSELRLFSEYSLRNYEFFFSLIERYSSIRVVYQTSRTWQYFPDGTKHALNERSLDPRELAKALRQAILLSSIELIEHASNFIPQPDTKIIYTTGAWSGARSSALLPIPVRPAKGQMLRVAIPQGLALHEVHRSEHVYVVPRLHGAQAGTALIGATVEDVGFDTQVHQHNLDALRRYAAELVPELASTMQAPMVEAWAGLRPMTPDFLPMVGAIDERTFLAAGHFRNGILLAPGTAKVIADLVEGKTTAIDLSSFVPGRFA